MTQKKNYKIKNLNNFEPFVKQKKNIKIKLRLTIKNIFHDIDFFLLNCYLYKYIKIKKLRSYK